MIDYGRIDVHHHLAKQYQAVFDMPNGESMVWWSPEAALGMMDRNRIRKAILSPVQSPRHKGKSTRSEIRRINEDAAAVAQLRPDKFSFFASANLLAVDDAIAEASYGLDQLGAAGILLFTNLGPAYLGDAAFDPLLAELNRRRTVVFVHPLHLPCPLVSGIPGHVCDFLQSTVRAATNLVLKGTLQRYSQVKFILCHGGGYIPYAIQRLSRSLAAIHPERTADQYLEEYRKFYYDTALAVAPASLSALLSFASADHVVYGSDFPFSQPDEVSFLAEQFDQLTLDGQIRCGINYANAAALFPQFSRQRQAEKPQCASSSNPAFGT